MTKKDLALSNGSDPITIVPSLPVLHHRESTRDLRYVDSETEKHLAVETAVAYEASYAQKLVAGNHAHALAVKEDFISYAASELAKERDPLSQSRMQAATEQEFQRMVRSVNGVVDAANAQITGVVARSMYPNLPEKKGWFER